MNLSEYQTEATKTAIYPGQGNALGLSYIALKMNGEAGEFAEHVGKAIRDDGLMDFDPDVPGMSGFVAHSLTNHRKELLIKEVGDVLWYLAAACNELNISLEDVAIANIEKLRSRKERGVLGGSGDER